MTEAEPTNQTIQTIQTIKQSNNLALTLKFWPLIALLTIGLCFLTEWVAKVIFGIELPEQASLKPILDQLRSAFVDREHFVLAAKNLGLILIFAPVFEEILFRLVLWKLPAKGLVFLAEKLRLEAVAPAITVAVAVLASAVFSAAHYLQMPWPNNAFVALFFFGLAQCWLYRKTSRLWCPMLNHFLFNLTNLVLLFILPESV